MKPTLQNQTSVRYPTMVIFTLTVALFASGCGKGKSKNLEEPANRKGSSVCFKPDQGGNADNKPANVVALSHGIPMNVAEVENVLKASAIETTRSIERNRAQVFKLPATRGTCKTMSFLNETPAKILELFKKTSTTKKNSVVIGRFMSGEEPETDGVPTLLVREDTTRWTLVHEYMHYLIYLQGLKQPGGMTDTEMKKQYRKKYISLDLTLKNVEEGKLPVSDLRIPIENFVKVFVLFIKTYPLSEVAIETYLADQFTNGEFKFTSDERKNSNWYIRQSAKKALSYINELIDKVTPYKTDPKIFESMSKLTQLRKEIEVAIPAKQKTHQHAKSFLNGHSGDEPPKSFVPCSHWEF